MERQFFTISACNRCRKRKSRCDARLPACLSCQQTGSKCEYTDVRTKTTVPRDYICSLENEAERLELELRELKAESQSTQRHSQHATPHDAGESPSSSSREIIGLDGDGAAHYLGSSSGLHIGVQLARSVFESAQRDSVSFDVFPERPRRGSANSHSHHNDRTDAEASQKAAFPSQDAAMNMLEIFFNQYQAQYPIVVKDQFVQDTQNFYNNSSTEGTSHKDVSMRFMLLIIFAISLLTLSKENQETLIAAESFHSSAMSDLTTVMQRKSPETLQCLLLLLLYSLLIASSGAIWYISGLSMRMCIDLGFHSETIIRLSPTGVAAELEADSKRRLFWVTYTFDRTLSIILGRPFTLDDKRIDVEYPSRSLPADKRSQTAHWFKFQRLLSDIVSHLHTVKPSEKAESSESLSKWTTDMSQRLSAWITEATAIADSRCCTLDWWSYWYQNALLILYRPSPNNPVHGTEASSTCYTAAKNMIQSSFVRLHKGLMDFSWIELHYQFMGGITLLFLVWNSADVRKQARQEWPSFKSCLVQWQTVLTEMVSRWDRVSQTKDALEKLADATVHTVEQDMTQSSHRNTNTDILKPTPDVQFEEHRTRRQLQTEVTPATADVTRSTPTIATDAEQEPSSTLHDTSSTLLPEASPDGLLEVDQISDLPVWPDQDAPFPFPDNLSAMLNEEMWWSFQPYENTVISDNSGSSEYFPVPLPETGAAFCAWPFDNRTRHPAWTGSVLNFHGSWDDDNQASEAMEGFSNAHAM